MEIDVSAAADGASESADVCIVGAGPVGMSLAHSLRSHGRRVVILESGGADSSQALRDLNDGQVYGDTDQVLRNSRFRGVGGTASVWSTALLGGMAAKYAELDPLDFKQRDAIPGGGWPITHQSLVAYYARAATLVGRVQFTHARAFRDESYKWIEFSAGGLINRSYRFGRPDIFTELLPAQLRTATDVLLLRGATATRITPTAGKDSVREIGWKTLTGRSGRVRATHYVLAAGGIENARLLLAEEGLDVSSRRHQLWLGRGYMEHPVDGSLRLLARIPELWPEPGCYAPHPNDQGECIMGRIGLAADLLESENVPNASIRLIPRFADPTRLVRLLRAGGRRLSRVPPLSRLGSGLTGLARRRAARDNPEPYLVLVDLEQAPHPDNRVVLTSESDSLGMPRIALHWRWRPDDQQQRERTLKLIARELERNGVGAVYQSSEPSFNTNSCHHLGTTRMHPDPAEGVVDQDLRVHGIENLYAVGSSVFPSAGWANPTLTSIALSLRLAEHLASA